MRVMSKRQSFDLKKRKRACAMAGLTGAKIHLGAVGSLLSTQISPGQRPASLSSQFNAIDLGFESYLTEE